LPANPQSRHPAGPFQSLRAAFLTALFLAFGAAAAFCLDVGVEIILAVIDGDLFVRPDTAAGDIDDAMLAPLDGVDVRPAGVIDVARDVAAGRAVDRPVRVDLEHIARATRFAPFGLGIGHPPSDIADDELTFPESSGCEQAEPGRCAADAEGTL
jgi:hypothetical protein